MSHCFQARIPTPADSKDSSQKDQETSVSRALEDVLRNHLFLLKHENASFVSIPKRTIALEGGGESSCELWQLRMNSDV